MFFKYTGVFTKMRTYSVDLNLDDLLLLFPLKSQNCKLGLKPIESLRFLRWPAGKESFSKKKTPLEITSVHCHPSKLPNKLLIFYIKEHHHTAIRSVEFKRSK